MTSPGLPLGPYIVDRLLGRGGMGEVWRATDTRLNRPVALKFLTAVGADDVERFRREATLAASLSHPGIAAIYEVGDAGGRPFLAMQLIDGRPLRGWTGAPRDAARLVREAAQAIEYAHGRNVIHRDIKPENLMVAGERLYVMDFGLARSVGAERGASLTASGMTVGTPSYMPPEQARGEKATPQSDVYSLGATLYELLSGRPPFDGPTVFDVLNAVVHDDPRRLTGIPVELEAIVMKCLEKGPAQRYASVRALGEDLDRWLANEPVSARRIGVVTRTARKLRKKPALVAVAAIALAFGAYALVTAVRHRRETDSVRATQEALAELNALRMRSYKPGWRLTEADIAEYERIAARAPPTADGFFIIGRVRHLLSDPVGAERAYEKALAHDPRHAWALLFSGRLMIDQSMRDRFTYGADDAMRRQGAELAAKAVERIERGVARGGLPAMELDLARAYALLSRREEAKAYCDAAIERWRGKDFWEEFLLIRGLADARTLIANASEALRHRPSYAEAYYWLAVARQVAGEARAAVLDLDIAISIHPRDAAFYNERGNARATLGENGAAIEDFTEALKWNPRYGLAATNRGAVRLTQGDPKAALADFDLALALSPSLASAHANRALAKEQLGDVAGARADLERSLELDPLYAKAYSDRGLLKFKSGDAAGAEKDYDHAIALNGPVQAWYNRGALRIGRGDEAGADADFAAAAARGFAPAHVSRGTLRLRQGNAAGALIEGEAAVQKLPSHADAWALRGAARGETGDFAGALADYEKALTLAPLEAEHWYGRGRVHHNAGEVKRAAEDYGRAIELDARHVLALTNRAVLKLRQGDRLGAVADCTAALAAEPESVPPRASRAIAYYQMDNMKGAIEDLTAVLKAEPENATAWTYRGFARYTLGDDRGAVGDLDQALKKMASDDPKRGEVERVLKDAKKRVEK